MDDDDRSKCLPLPGAGAYGRTESRALASVADRKSGWLCYVLAEMAPVLSAAPARRLDHLARAVAAAPLSSRHPPSSARTGSLPTQAGVRMAAGADAAPALTIAFIGFRHGHIGAVHQAATLSPSLEIVGVCEEHAPTHDALADTYFFTHTVRTHPHSSPLRQ